MRAFCRCRQFAAVMVAAVLVVQRIWAAEEPFTSLEAPYPTVGSIERKDPRLDELIPSDAHLEKLAEGFAFSEGPVWMKEESCLLFSDIPRNQILRWKEGEGVSVFMKPSGYTGVVDYGNEPGSNGLAIDEDGRLLVCEHGDRRISVLTKDGGKMTLVDRYGNSRFNSPNDLCVDASGAIYFTDPPYGLPDGWGDPRRELDFCGIYRLQKTPRRNPRAAGAIRVLPAGGDHRLTLLASDLSRPNGIALSPDGTTLYVANSDPENAVWMSYDVEAGGMLGFGRVFFDATPWVKIGKKGLPDGLKVDQAGNVFATGPGGLHVFAPDGAHLGTIDTGVAAGNCAWGDDGSTLYITASNYLARIKTATKGHGW